MVPSSVTWECERVADFHINSELMAAPQQKVIVSATTPFRVTTVVMRWFEGSLEWTE
jgi:hypothetical protein